MSELPLVPVPLRVTRSDGDPFVLGPGTRVVRGSDPVTVGAADAVARVLGRLTGCTVPVVDHDDGTPGAVRLRRTDRRAEVGLAGEPLDLDLDPGGADARAVGAYRVAVTAGSVELTALAGPGLLHAAATLAQLGATDAGGRTVLAPVEVVDVPRFGWRGLSLDVARHFVTVPVVQTVIDVMASLKLNVLHLHLTDDQGWRVHLPSRPELTARSGGTAVGGEPGGFYSPDDLAEITAHASALGITVVPEIDLPGHVNAALHAYGELTPSGRPTDEYTGIEVGFSRLHADLPSTDPFLRDVLGDLAAVTPGPYVHIGGDEVFTMEPAEYVRLVQAAARHVRSAGKRVVGWQEVAKAELGAGSLVQLWEEPFDVDQALTAVDAGARLLLSPGSRAYLDMKYDAATELGLEWAGHIELRDAYEWDPLAMVPGAPTASVAGVEAALWTETVRTADDLFFLLLPRLAAVAEVAWSVPERCGWDDFAIRVRGVAPRWTRDSLPWYRSPQITW